MEITRVIVVYYYVENMKCLICGRVFHQKFVYRDLKRIYNATFLPEYPKNKMKVVILHSTSKKGTVAEWLGGGLQNLIRRFESVRYL